MLRKTFLPAIFLLLAYGFTVSADFKTITAGVAIFLFGMLSLEEGFKTFTAGTLEKILKASTNSPSKSMTCRSAMKMHWRLLSDRTSAQR